jgi:hypothetical protein
MGMLKITRDSDIFEFKFEIYIDGFIKVYFPDDTPTDDTDNPTMEFPA